MTAQTSASALPVCLWCVVLSLAALSTSQNSPTKQRRTQSPWELQTSVRLPESHATQYSAVDFSVLVLKILYFSTLGPAWARKQIFLFAFCFVIFLFFFPAGESFNSFICVTLKSESGKWFSLFTWKLQSHSPSLRSWQVEPTAEICSELFYNEGSKRALPPIFTLSLFFNNNKKKSGNWNLRCKIKQYLS